MGGLCTDTGMVMDTNTGMGMGIRRRLMGGIFGGGAGLLFRG